MILQHKHRDSARAWNGSAQDADRSQWLEAKSDYANRLVALKVTPTLSCSVDPEALPPPPNTPTPLPTSPTPFSYAGSFVYNIQAPSPQNPRQLSTLNLLNVYFISGWTWRG